MYNSKNLKHIFILILLLCAYSDIFSAKSTITNSYNILNSNSFGQAPAQVVVLTGEEKLPTPFDDLMNKTEFIPLNRITQPLFFEPDLFITEYKELLENKFKSDYPEAFKNKVINDFFFDTLSEYTYSMNGRLDPDFFNKVADGREKYFKVRHFIMDLKMYYLMKLGLQYLCARAFIYEHTLESADQAITDLAKIPEYPVLYIVNPPDFLIPKDEKGKFLATSRTSQSDKTQKFSNVTDEYGNEIKGDYINFGMGENLYYICANYYPEFINLPGTIQMEILDNIYKFNITLTISKPIKADNTLWSYLKEQFDDINRDPLLRYRIKLRNSWLLLPRNLDNYTHKGDS